MEFKLLVNWWTAADRSEPKVEHEEALNEAAVEQIVEKWKEGYTSGQLFDNIRMTDEDPEDGIAYEGYWSISQELEAPKPSKKWFSVTGRIPGDQEDSCYVMEASDRAQAVAMFEKSIYEDDESSEKDDVIEEYGDAIYINSVVCSDTQIIEIS